MQKEKDNIDQLRKRLQDCEDYILRIAKPFDGYWDKATEDVIADHLDSVWQELHCAKCKRKDFCGDRILQ